MRTCRGLCGSGVAAGALTPGIRYALHAPPPRTRTQHTPAHASCCRWVDGTHLRYGGLEVVVDWDWAPTNCGYLRLERVNGTWRGSLKAGGCDANQFAFVCETSESAGCEAYVQPRLLARL